MKNSNTPISPQVYTRCGDGENDFRPLEDGKRTGWELKMPGLTKREYFAGLAMQGMLENSSLTKSFIAEMAVKMADELLTALEKPTENGSI